MSGSAKIETGELRARNLRTVGALAALFLAPLLLSFWMYYGADWRPAGRTNHGELLQPPVPLQPLALPSMNGAAAVPVSFAGKWTLVYIGDGHCDAACHQALYTMRQTRLSLANNMTRVNRVFLATANCCDREFLSREHAGLAVFDASGESARAFLQQFPQQDRAVTLFIVDPLGNLMMSHDVRANPKWLLEDLKKLLKLSHIG